MKRQRGRNRGGSGGGGGGKPQQHNVNRAFDSNGPDNVKVRGNAQHVFEKYQALARDAASSGDRVLAENYLQHAEHYFRVLRAVQPNRPVADIIGRDNFASGYDIDFEDESGAQAQAEEAPAEGGDQQQAEGEGGEQRAERQDRQDRDREWQGRRDRDDRPRDRDRDYDRPREERRDDRPRENRDYDRPRNNDDRPRDGQNREGQNREGQGRRDRFRDRDRDRNRDYDRDRPRDPMAVIEPEGGQVAAQPAPAPEADAGPRLRSQDGSESFAPAFLQARPAAERPEAAAEDGEVKKPRRRRAPRSFEGGEGEAPAATESEDA